MTDRETLATVSRSHDDYLGHRGTEKEKGRGTLQTSALPLGYGAGEFITSHGRSCFSTLGSATQVSAALFTGRAHQRLQHGDVRQQRLGQAMSLLEVRGTIVGEPGPSLRILPHQDLQRQVDGDARRGKHQWRAGLRVAEGQPLGRRHFYSDL